MSWRLCHCLCLANRWCLLATLVFAAGSKTYAVMNVFHSTKYNNKTMQEFYNVFLLSSKVHCGRTCELSEMSHRNHVRSSEELTKIRHTSRYKSFPLHIHHKCIVEIANNVHLALSRIGMKQKLRITSESPCHLGCGIWWKDASLGCQCSMKRTSSA
jgi:hypothetical protein